MTNVLLIILILILAYDKIPHTHKKSIISEPRATKKEENEEKDKLTEEMEQIMAYKVEDAINSYRRDE